MIMPNARNESMAAIPQAGLVACVSQYDMSLHARAVFLVVGGQLL
jgi:hypothetical protein